MVLSAPLVDSSVVLQPSVDQLYVAGSYHEHVGVVAVVVVLSGDDATSWKVMGCVRLATSYARPSSVVMSMVTTLLETTAGWDRATVATLLAMLLVLLSVALAVFALRPHTADLHHSDADVSIHANDS